MQKSPAFQPGFFHNACRTGGSATPFKERDRRTIAAESPPVKRLFDAFHLLVKGIVGVVLLHDAGLVAQTEADGLEPLYFF